MSFYREKKFPSNHLLIIYHKWAWRNGNTYKKCILNEIAEKKYRKINCQNSAVA